MATFGEHTRKRKATFKALPFPFRYKHIIFAAVQADDVSRNTPQKYEIQGKRASLNEYNTALALEKLGLEYVFQVPFFGGKTRKFGVVVDFIVQTVPSITPLWVHGEHWHMGQQRTDDRRDMDRVFQYLSGDKGGVQLPVEIWGSDTETEEDAVNALRRLLL